MFCQNLKTFKEKGEKIACLTAYDATFARIMEENGVDVVLVGDSLGNVVHGQENTHDVTMEDMIYHTSIVAKSLSRCPVITDMPIHSYKTGEAACLNAKRLINAGANWVKIEGGSELSEIYGCFKAANVPVCGHLGLLPQSLPEKGGYQIQGRDVHSREAMIEDALALEKWGAEALVLECIPEVLGREISEHLNIPTIGIGAGAGCDGQVLVCYDILGIGGRNLRFVRNFIEDSGSIPKAVQTYVRVVKSGHFPGAAHSF